MHFQTDRLARTVEITVQLDYALFLPDGYTDQPDRSWPLILFLHGSGERGDDIARVYKHGLPKRLAQRHHLPAIVVAPQCPHATTWSEHLPALTALLDDIGATYRVDHERVYATGLSMGGAGTWHLAARYPDRFAAIVPICGSAHWYIGDPADTVRPFQHLSIWVFHGALDTAVPLIESAGLVAALRTANADVRLTIYDDLPHNAWDRAYATPALYDWLFAQRRRNLAAADHG